MTQNGMLFALLSCRERQEQNLSERSLEATASLGQHAMGKAAVAFARRHPERSGFCCFIGR